MIVFNVLAALFRNNAIYALVVFCIIAIIMIKGLKEKGKIVILLFSIYIITYLCKLIIIYYNIIFYYIPFVINKLSSCFLRASAFL